VYHPDNLTTFGRQKVGREGIAEVKEQLNSAGARTSHLPLRRFIVGGVGAKSALLAYEQEVRTTSSEAAASLP
jgi:hypothetical protein